MSADLKMAWRNVWRNPRRTILTIAAVAFACALLVFMLSMQFGSYDAMIDASVKISTGHLQVQAKGYLDNKEMRLVVEDPEAVARILEKTPKIKAFTFRANAFSLSSSKERTYGALVIGIDPSREIGVSTLKNLVRKGDFLTDQDYNQALVGRLLAKNLQLDLGDEVVILGQGRDGSVAATVVIVKGIFSSGIDELDRATIQIPIKCFQDTYSMGDAVHEVLAVCHSLDDVKDAKESVLAGLRDMNPQNKLTALDWSEIMPGLLQAIKMDLVGGLIFYFLLILVVAFSILNTFLMAVLERTKEFGVMMAIGVTKSRLVKLLLMESTAMTSVGLLAGLVMGSLVTLYFQSHGLDFSEASDLMAQFGISGKIYPRLSIWSISIGAGLVLVITFIAAMYPSLKVRSLSPVEALAHV